MWELERQPEGWGLVLPLQADHILAKGQASRSLCRRKARGTPRPGVVDLYRAAAEREIVLADDRGTLTPDAVRGLRAALAMRS